MRKGTKAERTAAAREWRQRTGRTAEPHPEETVRDRQQVRYSITEEGRRALEAARNVAVTP